MKIDNFFRKHKFVVSTNAGSILDEKHYFNDLFSAIFWFETFDFIKDLCDLSIRFNCFDDRVDGYQFVVLYKNEGFGWLWVKK